MAGFDRIGRNVEDAPYGSGAHYMASGRNNISPAAIIQTIQVSVHEPASGTAWYGFVLPGFGLPAGSYNFFLASLSQTAVGGFDYASQPRVSPGGPAIGDHPENYTHFYYGINFDAETDPGEYFYIDWSVTGVTNGGAIIDRTIRWIVTIDPINQAASFVGGAGDDIYHALSGDNIMSGGGGINTLDYSLVLAGVNVNLATGLSSSNGFGGADTFTDFQRAIGSAFNDTLTGDAGANTLRGLAGDDTLIGGGGDDVLDPGGGVDTVNAGDGNDTVLVQNIYEGQNFAGGAGTDTLLIIGGELGNGGYLRTELQNGALSNFEAVTFAAGANATIVFGLSQVGAGLKSGTVVTGSASSDVLSFIASTPGTYSLASISTFSFVNWTDGVDYVSLSANMSAPGNYRLTGNGQSNFIQAFGGNDTLDGGAGADIMMGGAGNDNYVVDNVGDTITENANEGTDTVTSSLNYTLGANLENLILTGAALYGAGNALDNTITGNAGANKLNGGDGADTLIGGAGADQLKGGNGVDTASYAGASAGVTANLLNAALNTGDAAGDTYSSIEVLIGSAFDDTLTGSGSANRLNGGAGADTMSGDNGNDTYIVDNVGDLVIETKVAGGTDTVQSYISYQLGANVENLSLIGSAAVNGVGNTLANVITGNGAANSLNGGAGDDTLKGGAGHDVLKGGAGADNFVFASINAADSDTISDFSAVDDTISLDNAVLTALGADGALAAGAFWSNATGAAHDVDDRIIYNINTGELFYDADGNSAGAAVLIATLTGRPAITAADFIVI